MTANEEIIRMVRKYFEVNTDISKLSIAAHEVNFWHQMKVGWANSMIDSIMALKDAMRPLLLWRVQP
ncbi:hypothetical protein PENSUB_4442 [Penicillium subrubescens]|uniref:Uncharacterized protein n=1 Tax=Penicillium subrubescens TaxID=1316194 RepID=A0A1Q5UCF9_9EURO|nr:hypothetical protein PENSUB_4442 [Penicillium subrubescens]